MPASRLVAHRSVQNTRDSQHVRADPPSFYSLAVAAGMPPALVESCVGLATFGFATSYLLVMGDQAPLILSDIVGTDIAPHSLAWKLTTSKYAGKIWITILGGVVGCARHDLPLFIVGAFRSALNFWNCSLFCRLPWMMMRSLKYPAISTF
jgi:hypothetical protein